MARAIDWAIIRDKKDAGDFLAVNVGSDEWNYQVKDLAEAVAKVVPGVVVSINKDAQPDKRSYRVSFDLFRKLAPKHQPVVDLTKTICELKEGLEAIGFTDENFRNSKYMRLNVLTDLRNRALLTEKLEWTDHQKLGRVV
jgi:nucleoside-diphosphate-sugar epimerase